MTATEIIGFIGSGLVLWAFEPQIRHLVQEKCSAGISRRAYTLWSVAGLFLLIHAIMIRDAVFIFLQIVNVSLTLTILILAQKYKE